MALYRKIVVVEAEIYKPGMEDGFTIYGEPYVKYHGNRQIVKEGDYIVSVMNGRYPVEPSVFKTVYEPVKSE